VQSARVPLYVWIVLAMGLGLLLGPLLGPAAAPLGEIGKLLIQLIKAVATPLLFFAIVNAILKTEVDKRLGARLLFFSALNACIALGIGMLLSNLIRPGEHLVIPASAAKPGDAALYSGKKLQFLETLASYVPSNVVSPFAENNLIPIIVIALLLGFALRTARREQEFAGVSAFKAIEDGVTTALRAMELVLGWVITLIPLAVFGVVAKIIGENGYAPLRGLGVYVIVGVLGLFLHVVITYQLWIRFFAKIPLTKFWKHARDPVVYAMGTNSSLATLPVTLRALDRLGVRKASSAMGACVGTNLNNDGIILYEGMAVLFVAQANGIHLGVSAQLLAAGTALLAAIGVAGVPEAGFISLALVLNTVGLSPEVLPLLLAVDWVIARGRSMTNVLSDMVLSILIDVRPASERESDLGPNAANQPFVRE
jgi:DAACS family dicarboxylate/amino acid:cation (Na+ or H+) symporter